MHRSVRSVFASLLAVVFAFILGLTPTAAQAASNGSAVVTAAGGKIKGSGPKGGLRVVGLSHRVTTGTNNGGRSNGSRRHGVLTLTVEVDRAMPELMGAWASAQVLSTVRVKLNGARGNYVVELRQAHISEATLVASVGPEGKDHLVLKFDYQKIFWRSGSVESEDTW